MGPFDFMPPPEMPGRRKTAGEEVTSFSGTLVFPALTFLVALEFPGRFSVWVLPLVFAAVVLAMGRYFGCRPMIALVTPFFCALASVMAGLFGSMLGYF